MRHAAAFLSVPKIKTAGRLLVISAISFLVSFSFAIFSSFAFVFECIRSHHRFIIMIITSVSAFDLALLRVYILDAVY